MVSCPSREPGPPQEGATRQRCPSPRLKLERQASAGRQTPRPRSSPIETHFPSQRNSATDSTPRALRQRRLQEMQESHGLWRDLPVYSTCGNFLERTAATTDHRGLSPGTDEACKVGGQSPRKLARSLYMRDMCHNPLQGPTEALPSPLTPRTVWTDVGKSSPRARSLSKTPPRPASIQKVGCTVAAASLWTPSSLEDGGTINAVGETELLIAAERKLEDWMSFGEWSDDSLARIPATPADGGGLDISSTSTVAIAAASITTVAAGLPSKSGTPARHPELIGATSCLSNLAPEQRRDINCPIRAGHRTPLGRKRAEAETSTHRVGQGDWRPCCTPSRPAAGGTPQRSQ